MIDEVKKKVKGKNLIEDFKEFAIQGNVLDLAVGVIVGTAFKDVVNSLVSDILMPPIGYLTGRVDFSNLYFNLTKGKFTTDPGIIDTSDAVLKYGVFLSRIIDFVIIAIVVFLIVKQFNMLRIKEDAKPKKKTKKCTYCFTEISRKATRCPNCTSKLALKVEKVTDIKGGDAELPLKS